MMKLPLLKFSFVLLLAFSLAACVLGSIIPAQVTSFHVGCHAKDVEVSEYVVDLNGEERWSAQCDGKTYFCRYLPESGSSCYETSEEK